MKNSKTKKDMTREQLEEEIERIAQYIVDAKLEIIAISPPVPDEGNDKHVAGAAVQLNEVVKDTEVATNTIMDKADAVMALSGQVTDVDISGKLMEHAVGILEACSFQDITGQRIRKVMATLEQIELRLNRLIKLFGGTLPEGVAIAPIETKERRADEDLMRGPQLSGSIPSQDDVDKLFSSN